ncbi:MAG TPA: chemotaxis protein CheB [Chitinophagales bacterium]|nr:chemotaxis protein CheB [Chitinophagales bacterium]
MYKAAVIGTSSGGMAALKAILPLLPAGFSLPVIVVQHVGANADNYWVGVMDEMCALHVKEADEKEQITPGNIYVAPPNYHLLVETDRTLSLSVDEKVNFARPSIDVLFESAALAYKKQLVGIVLTGANHDGAKGLKKIKEMGGLAIVQDPATADSSYMPAAAIAATQADYIVPVKDIANLLIKIIQL